MATWGARVVVVDDDLDTLGFVTCLLESAGAQVIPVSAPGQALATIAGVMPDVVLIALEMPGLDSRVLMGKVRTLSPEKGGRVPAVALTSALDPGASDRALGTGFQALIFKPLPPEDLLAVVGALAGEAVERRQGSRERSLWPLDVRRERRLEVRLPPAACGPWLEPEHGY